MGFGWGKGMVGGSPIFSFLPDLPSSNWPAETPSSPHYPGNQKSQEELMGVKGALSAGSCSIKVS